MHNRCGHLWASWRACRQRPRVYCAHEYTLDNLRFARAAEPGNRDLERRWRAAKACRQQGRPTLPSTIALERATNPFLRCMTIASGAAVPEQLGEGPFDTPEQAFAALREWKDHF